MGEFKTIAYDFVYRTGQNLPSDGLIGDPELRRKEVQEPPPSEGPKTPRTVIGRIIVPTGDSTG